MGWNVRGGCKRMGWNVRGVGVRGWGECERGGCKRMRGM